MATFIVDTCVFRDFYEDRTSKTGRPLGLYASQFFTKIFTRKDIILFSEGLIQELSSDYSKENIEDMLQLLSHAGVLKNIEVLKEEFIEARTLSIKRKLPFIDCLNAVQAKTHDAVLVTRDMHYFESLRDVIEAKRPEEVT